MKVHIKILQILQAILRNYVTRTSYTVTERYNWANCTCPTILFFFFLDLEAEFHLWGGVDAGVSVSDVLREKLAFYLVSTIWPLDSACKLAHWRREFINLQLESSSYRTLRRTTHVHSVFGKHEPFHYDDSNQIKTNSVEWNRDRICQTLFFSFFSFINAVCMIYHLGIWYISQSGKCNNYRFVN